MSVTDPRTAFAAYFKDWDGSALGLAVSGGGDSIALLRLAVVWAKKCNIRLAAVTVDHGLRAAAADEARFVAATCTQLEVPHATLRWDGWDGTGNLQDRARQARYGLIADWAGRQDIDAVALAHTVEDQAETFLMRLARASGVDGLSAMSDRTIHGVRFVRPLLASRRDDLRTCLKELEQTWIEDPSNRNPTFDRVRARQQLGHLAELGISPDTLSEVAENLGQARAALNWATHQFALSHVRMQGPDVMIARSAFLTLPEELQRRLLVHVLVWISAADYAPRRQSVALMLRAVKSQTRMNLHGCAMTHRRGAIYLHREYAAVAGVTANPASDWDGRWRLDGPVEQGLTIAALGQDGVSQLADWRALERPAAAVMADPAVWRGKTLVAAPLSGWANGWRAELAMGRTDCHSALLSH